MWKWGTPFWKVVWCLWKKMYFEINDSEFRAMGSVVCLHVHMHVCSHYYLPRDWHSAGGPHKGV